MKLSGILTATTNIVVIGTVAFLLGRPGGAAFETVKEYRAKTQLRKRISQEWNDFIQVGGRIDEGKGPVALVEFSDYQCPFCKQAHGALSKFLAGHPDVGILYRHFPLSIHPAAEGAARSAICAEREGRFLQMHVRLFETSEWQTDTNWTREAIAAGVVDTLQFKACLRSQLTSTRLDRDKSLGARLAVSGTPTFVYPKGIRAGIISPEELLEIAKSPH